MRATTKLIRSKYFFLFVPLFAYRLFGIASNSNFEKGLNSTASDLIKMFGGSDMGSYLVLARDLSNLSISPENIWILNLWPPGQAILETISILTGPLFVFTYVAITSFALVLPSLILWDYHDSREKFVIKFVPKIAAILWLISPLVFEYSISDSGLFGADLQGIALLSSSYLLFEKAIRESDEKSAIRYGLLAGALLGSALYFRWAFILILLPTLLLLTLSFLVSSRAVKPPYLQKKPFSTFVHSNPATYKWILISTALTVLPWTLVAIIVLHPFNPTWSMSDYIWAQRWLFDSDLISQGGKWAVDGGLNWGCNLAGPKECSEFRKIALANDPGTYGFLRNAALNLAATNPTDFFAVRFGNISNYWYQPMGASGSVIGNFLLASTTIFALITSLLMFILHKDRARAIRHILISVLLFTAPLLEHWEGRYFFPMMSIAFFYLSIQTGSTISALQSKHLSITKSDDEKLKK